MVRAVKVVDQVTQCAESGSEVAGQFVLPLASC